MKTAGKKGVGIIENENMNGKKRYNTYTFWQIPEGIP
jgi:hypothetical protein